MNPSSTTTTIGPENTNEGQDRRTDQPEGQNTLAPYKVQTLQLDPRDLLPVKTAQEMAMHLQRLQELKDTAMVEGYHYGPPFPGSEKSALHKPGMELILGFFGLHTKPIIEHVTREYDREPPFLMYEIRSHIYINGTDIVIAQGLGSANTYEVKYRWRNVPRDLVPDKLDPDKLETTGGQVSEPDWVIDKLLKHGITIDLTEGKYGKPEEYWRKWEAAMEDGAYTTGTRITRAGNEMGVYLRDETLYRIPNDAIFDTFNTVLKMAEKRADMDATLKTGASALFSQDEEMRALLENTPPTFEDFDGDSPPKAVTPRPAKPKGSDRDRRINGGDNKGQKVRPPDEDTPWQEYIANWGNEQWKDYWVYVQKTPDSPKPGLGLTRDEVHAALEVESVKDFQGTRGEHNRRLLNASKIKRGMKPLDDADDKDEAPAEVEGNAQPKNKPFKVPTTKRPASPVQAPPAEPDEAETRFGIISSAIATAQPGSKPRLDVWLVDANGVAHAEPLISEEIKTSELRNLFGERVPKVLSTEGTTLVKEIEFLDAPVSVEYIITDEGIELQAIIEE